MKSIKIKNLTIARDAIHNTARDSGATDDYARGVVLGVVAGIMACKGCSFDSAFDLVKKNLPDNVRPNYAPECWLK